MIAVLALASLACGNVPQEPDTQATVAAFYATITAQAASGSPFPTRAVTATSGPSATPPPSITPPASPTPPEARTGNGEGFIIPRCQGTITVDASDADWGWYRGTVVGLNTATFGEEEWQGTGDLSGQVRLCWTDTTLYLIADVVDDIHVQTEQGIRQWRGDEIEVVFDGDLRGDFYEREPNDDDIQLGFSPGNFADIPPSDVQYRPQLDDDVPLEVVARRPIDSGGNYTLEASTPWSLLGVTPHLGIGYGLCVAISDNDHVGTSQQDSMVSHCPEMETPEPMSWVTITLGQ
jgi:hypothetical protein